MPSSEMRNIEKTCEGYTPQFAKTNRAKATKTDKLLKMLRSKRGATIKQLQEASDWQAHSVRGFLSGTIKKKLGHQLTSHPDNKGVRRYRIVEA